MLGDKRGIPNIRDRDLSKEELGQLIALYEAMFGFFMEFDELRPQFASEPCIKFVCGGLDDVQKIVNHITDHIEYGVFLPGGLIEEIPLPVAAENPKKMAMPMLKISTDGACQPNPGRGGWAYVLNRDGVKTEAAGTVPQATNNQMELMAPIEALSVLPEPSDVEITSDSKYVVNGITGWIHKWKTNDWRTANKKPVQNRALWEQLDNLCQLHRVTWCWVPGHSGYPANERCDVLAYQQAGIPVNELPPWW